MEARRNRGSLPQVVVEEIALEGLEGVTLETHWMHLSSTFDVSLPLPQPFMDNAWCIIRARAKAGDLKFYKLPRPRETLRPYNRFEKVDSQLGVPIIPEKSSFARYKHVPIEDKGEKGSCEFYYVRKLIENTDICHLSLDDVQKMWGNTLVIVASQKLRYEVLIPYNVTLPTDLALAQYCMLEAIGRARCNGETTSGTWSLLDFCKDSAIVFYYKNRLLGSRLIKQQPFNEFRNGRLHTSSLLTLNRFFVWHKSLLMTIIETLIDMLKAAPDQRLPVWYVRSQISSLDSSKAYRNISMTHLFNKVFETLTVPRANTSKLPKDSSKTKISEDRSSLVLALRNANVSIDEIFSQGNVDENDEEETDDIFQDDQHTYVDMPLKDEFFHVLHRFGARGASQREINSYLCINHVTLRQILKRTLLDELCTSYFKDEGRQRIKMYVSAEYRNRVESSNARTLSVYKNMCCAEEPKFAEKVFTQWEDVPTISAHISVLTFDDTNPGRGALTNRQALRKALVIGKIDEKCIVMLRDLRHAIQVAEREQGHKDEVCQKSVRRLLVNMKMAGHVCLYQITLQNQEQVRIYSYATHPRIDIDHIVLRHEIIRLKRQFFLSVEDRRLRSEGRRKQLQKKALKMNKLLGKTGDERPCGPTANSKDVVSLGTFKPPKFLISRYLHEFLFYVVGELKNSSSPLEINEDLVAEWQMAEPSLHLREYLQELQGMESRRSIIAYTKEISWRTFVPPLPKYEDKPEGWAFFVDVMERMPLSLFNKIFRIERRPGETRLSEHLSHPIRQHYLMRQLPVVLQSQISRTQLQRIYGNILKLLNHMGLVQVSERMEGKDPLELWVYLNRRAKILDTTTSEASFNKINPDRSYEALLFNFNEFKDIQQYWCDLQRISVYTKLGFRRGQAGGALIRPPEIFNATVGFDEAPLLDNAHVPGDGRGAGGLAANLYPHIFRNWSWVVHTTKIPKLTRTGRGKLMRGARKIRTHMGPIKRLPSGAAAFRRKVLKKTGARDAIDRDALKNMKTLRVKWRNDEDDFLKIARAVYQYLAPSVASLGLLAVGRICRDMMRYTLGTYNKTSQACVRRSQFIIKMQRHLPEVPAWVNMLQTNEFFQRKYGEQFMTKLKQIYPNRVDFSAALEKHFMLIVSFLYKFVNKLNTVESVVVPRFTLPDTVAEFNKRFRERGSTPDDQATIKHTNPMSDFDLDVAITYSVLHSSLCCVRDKTLYHSQAFDIYKTFSEEVLHTAFTKARQGGLAVAIKRRNIQLIPKQHAGPAYLLSSRYRSRLSFLKIPYSVYDTFYKYQQTASATFSSLQKSETSKLELKSPTLGQLFYIGENLSRNQLSTIIKMPINILTIDAEHHQAVSSMDRILDHYHCMFDHAPQTEYTKHIEGEVTERPLRVKIHPANLSYKMHYTPYDFIAKLPSRQIHFFCALEHLQQVVDVNFGKLLLRQSSSDDIAEAKSTKDYIEVVECPFGCILREANYMNAIERIVHKRRSVLDELREPTQQQSVIEAISGGMVRLQPTNMLTLVRMLETFLREHAEPIEKMDLGRLAPSLRRSQVPIDWIDLCREILDFDASDDEDDEFNDPSRIDEFEPTLNKEERIVRAQDVFVVNLPTLQLQPVMPRVNIEQEIEKLRSALLQKVTSESHWKYSEDTIDSHLHEMDLKAKEYLQLQQVHKYIESRQSLGVSRSELLLQFPDKKFLQRALKLLTSYALVKRVGVSAWLYVHKSHVRQWLIHTYHIKRLESENAGGNMETLKRSCKAIEVAEVDEDVTVSKRMKLDNDGSEEITINASKRTPKPVKRFEPSEDGTIKSDASREVIAMRPQPWIRLNGSLNRRVLDRWLGATLTECIVRTGCLVHELFGRFPQMLPVDLMFLVELLSDLRCLHLKQIEKVETDIFTNYAPINESIVHVVHDPYETYVVANPDAVTRMSSFIGNKKYNTEFI